MLTCRTRLLITCAASALLVGLASAPQALAADLAPQKEIAVESPTWWTSGFVEVGGRFFLNNPQKNGMMNFGNNLGYYYQYTDYRPGPFSNVFLSAGTTDGLYQFDLYGKNIGYNDQSYGLSFSQAGSHYLDLKYDETPHIYGYGWTPYSGAGTGVLSINPFVAQGLRRQAANGSFATLTAPGNPGNATGVWALLNAASQPVTIGIQRNTTSADYRYTVGDWDLRANFSNMQRTGSLVDGIVFNWSTNSPTQVPRPVNDNTKNYGLSAEYAGTAPWGKGYSVKIGYNGSTYTDNFKYYLVQSPWCDTVTNTGCSVGMSPIAMVSTPPSNSMNSVNSTFSFDLPYKSRYVGTASYTNMQQNDPFLPLTVNPTVTFNNGIPGASPLALSARSLNGNVNTFLTNNVLTTKVTETISTKLTYRYYNYDNRTPTIRIPGFVGGDFATVGPSMLFLTNSYAPLNSVTMSYIKQNAGAQIDWKPWRTLNVGAAYGWEHYDWTHESAASTNENSIKGWADYKPYTWLNARLTGLFANRTVDNYNYMNNLGLYQFAPGGTLNKPQNLMFMPNQVDWYLAARQRTKIDFQIGVDVLANLRVTPSITYQNDYYPLNNNAAFIQNINLNSQGLWQSGLNWSRGWKPGIELSYALNPTTRVFAFYMYERMSQGMQLGNPPIASLTSATQMQKMAVTDQVNTFRVGVDTTVFERLDLKAAYTLVKAYNTQPLPVFNMTGLGGIAATANAFVNYMPVNQTSNRFEVGAKYNFADDWVRSWGLSGKMSFGLNYVFETNNVSNWQMTANYAFSQAMTTGMATFMGYQNPNYTVSRLAASLSYKW